MLRLDGGRKACGSTVAVDGLSLEGRSGEVLGLLGPNGAGETTTIHILDAVRAQREEGKMALPCAVRVAVGVVGFAVGGLVLCRST